MRNILLFGCLLLCANICKAQFQKGQRLLGGQAGFSSASDEYDYSYQKGYTQNTSFFLNGSLSRFKSPQVLNGMGLSYQYYYNHSNINDPNLEQRSYEHVIGAFAEKTRLIPLARKLDMALTGRGGLNYTFGKRTYVPSGANVKIEAITPYASGSIGVWYQLAQRLLLTCNFSNLLTLSYTYGATKSDSETLNSNHLNLSAGLGSAQLSGLTIGVQYVLK